MIKIKILDILDKKDRNLNWLAINAGITYSTLYNFAHQKTNSVTYDTLEKICKILSCDICDIIEYIPENTDIKESNKINKLDQIVNSTIKNNQYLPNTQDYIYRTLYSSLSKMKSYPNDNEEKRTVLKILLKCIENLLLPENKIIELIKLI